MRNFWKKLEEFLEESPGETSDGLQKLQEKFSYKLVKIFSNKLVSDFVVCSRGTSRKILKRCFVGFFEKIPE